MSASEWATRVQAFSSVFALGIAIWLSHKQYRQSEAARHADAQAALERSQAADLAEAERKLAMCIAFCEVASRVVLAAAGEILKPDWSGNPRFEYLVKLRDLKDAASQIPHFELPSPMALLFMTSVRTSLSDAHDHIDRNLTVMPQMDTRSGYEIYKVDEKLFKAGMGISGNSTFIKGVLRSIVRPESGFPYEDIAGMIDINGIVRNIKSDTYKP